VASPKRSWRSNSGDYDEKSERQPGTLKGGREADSVAEEEL